MCMNTMGILQKRSTRENKSNYKGYGHIVTFHVACENHVSLTDPYIHMYSLCYTHISQSGLYVNYSLNIVIACLLASTSSSAEVEHAHVFPTASCRRLIELRRFLIVQPQLHPHLILQFYCDYIFVLILLLYHH